MRGATAKTVQILHPSQVFCCLSSGIPLPNPRNPQDLSPWQCRQTECNFSLNFVFVGILMPEIILLYSRIEESAGISDKLAREP
jgi:hypothetical protein